MFESRACLLKLSSKTLKMMETRLIGLKLESNPTKRLNLVKTYSIFTDLHICNFLCLKLYLKSL